MIFFRLGLIRLRKRKIKRSLSSFSIGQATMDAHPLSFINYAMVKAQLSLLWNPKSTIKSSEDTHQSHGTPQMMASIKQILRPFSFPFQMQLTTQ